MMSAFFNVENWNVEVYLTNQHFSIQDTVCKVIPQTLPHILVPRPFQPSVCEGDTHVVLLVRGAVRV